MDCKIALSAPFNWFRLLHWLWCLETCDDPCKGLIVEVNDGKELLSKATPHLTWFVYGDIGFIVWLDLRSDV